MHCMFSYVNIFIPLLISLDLDVIPKNTTSTCTFLQADLCATYTSSPFAVILTIWTALQLVWVTMLVTVQLLQIARGLTTYEAMKPSKPAPLTSFMTTGDPSMGNAGIDAANRGPDPVGHEGHNHGPGGHKHTDGFEAWKRLLGVDTFIAVALHGRGSPQANAASRYKNPFSRGCITNCQDFWNDAGPVFGSKENGSARFGGERVNYLDMYETPEGMGYAPVSADDEV
jgi:hypothetical protein